MAEKRKKFEVPEQQENGVRINKYLGDAGVCSRREADTYIAEGKVTIDGQVALTGSRVMPGQTVTFMGKELTRQEQQVLIAFYKPVGIVCTTDTNEPDNVIDFINFGKRIYPIGRLDKDSEGLLLLTNDGDIVNKILRAGNHHEKEYQVVVNKPITPEFIKAMESGVPILDMVTKPCKLEPTGKNSFKIILTQGLNRQIRRMCEYLEYRVVSLKRIRIMHITLGRLNPGTYRNLTTQELDLLREELQHSTGAPAAEQKKIVKTEPQSAETKKFDKKFDRTDRKTYSKTDRKTDSRTDRKTDSSTDGKTDRRADRRLDSRTDSRTGSKTDRKSDDRTDRRVYSKIYSNSDGSTDRRTASKTDNRSYIKIDRGLDSRSVRRTDNMSDRKTDTKTDRRIESRIDRRTDTRTDSRTGGRLGGTTDRKARTNRTTGRTFK